VGGNSEGMVESLNKLSKKKQKKAKEWIELPAFKKGKTY
jgi:hypothetical protein